MDKEWREIKLFPKYLVNKKGQIKNKKTGYILKTRLDKDGYLRVLISIGGGKHKTPLVHRLVAQAFIPNPNNFPQINHKDEVKTNNNLDNLEWCTQQYNNAYGTHNEKVKIANQVKNGKKVKAIKDNKEYIFISRKEASRVLNLNKSNIIACLKGRLNSTGGYKFEEVA